MALWGGRFDEPTDEDLRDLNDSIEFDQVLVIQDIIGSMAYAQSMIKTKVLTQEEAIVIIKGLESVLEEFKSETFEFQESDEDIHTAVERRLIEIVGSVGGKLHTGRSRNDQVATDLRMWVRQSLDDVDFLISELQGALIEQASNHINTIMPGYTHLQPAQPITVAHWLMSFFWMLARDRDRMIGLQARVNEMPLGSGALAGHSFGLKRDELRSLLEFVSVSQNSLDAVSNRDFVAEALFVLSLLCTHLSRFAEDIIIYSNPSFGFVTLHDRYSTGSSLMPQKRNADPMELARGKTGRLIGNLTGFLATLKGLPSGYNKDLQEDKEPLMDSLNTIYTLLPITTAIVHTLQLNPDKMREALSEEMLATDVADYLVRKGMPFREAHHIVGSMVKMANDQNIQMSEIPLGELKKLSELFDKKVAEVFDFDKAVARKDADGGTAPKAVKRQIKNAIEEKEMMDQMRL